MSGEGGREGGMGRNDARKSNDILILTNKILIVCGPCSLHIITLFTVLPPHSYYTANDSDFQASITDRIISKVNAISLTKYH